MKFVRFCDKWIVREANIFKTNNIDVVAYFVYQSLVLKYRVVYALSVFKT